MAYFTKKKSFIFVKNYYFKKKFLIKNFFKFKKLLNFFSLIIIRKDIKNLFLNFSHLLFGNVFFKLTSGFFFKKALKRSYFAIEHLFKKFLIPSKFINFKKFFFLNIRAFFNIRGFKRVFKDYLKNSNLNILVMNNLSFKSHNGVRSKHKKRK